MNQSGIYEILNTVNGKRYIGSAVNFKRRRREHWAELRRNVHHCQHLQNAWNKHGGDAFGFNILLVCAPSNLIFYEQRCIDGFCPEYNKCLVAGSTLGMKHTAATRAQMSETRQGNTYCLGHVASEEARANLSKARAGKTPALGMKHTPESRARISAALKLRPRKPASAKQKEKQSLAMSGRKLSSDHRAKLSIARVGNTNRLGIPHTPESKAAISAGVRAARLRKKEMQV